MKAMRSPVWGATVVFTVALLSSTGQGRAQKPEIRHLVDDQAGSFSPDGKTIAFERWFSTLRFGVDTHPVPRRSVVLLMRADGSRKRVLRHPSAGFEYDATFSPNGRSILFVRNERVHLMRRDGSGPREVRSDFLEQACPRFSPDESLISLWRGRGKSGAYFVMNADGSGLRRIVNGGRQRFAWGCPSWFPDGRRLVFAKGFSLYVAAVDGTSIERITDNTDGDLYRPSVSPDSRWIVCDGWLSGSGYGIVLMRADGTGLSRITTGRDEIQNDAGASWSPDGKRIVFSGYRGTGKGRGVYVINRDGSGLHRLSNVAR